MRTLIKVNPPKFKLEDFWIGVYWERGKHVYEIIKNPRNPMEEIELMEDYTIWICLIPCWPIKIRYMRYRSLDEAWKLHYDDGEG